MNDPARHRRLMDLFDEVCDLPAGERAVRIAALRSDGETALADDLAKLLQADRDTVRGVALEIGAAALLHVSSAPPAQQRLPERIGGYRVVGLLGHGGMGVVYEAEQELPRRRVAVKVVRAEVDTPALRRRFVHETQILGRLSHPGISRIYEAGIDGEQCFFAMELVAGQPLTDHADAALLDTDARLELLARVCEAVHHAHLRGVIHCDLKPANVLVSADGQPKILDFGVARIVDPDGLLTGGTMSGLLVGTPAYMSPEQTAVTAEALDARTDVYSLGVIGWELLAGRLPHDYKGKAIPEILRIVRDVDPPPLGRVVPALRGDVETVFGKALAREPEARYQSAQALADDLRRTLRHEPIAARPPTAAYQIKKFAQRNRALVTALGGLALALVAGVIVTAALLVKTERARAELRRALDLQTIAFARGSLGHDPTAALARLKTLSDGADWGEALAVAREAIARGAAAEVFSGHPGEVHSAVFWKGPEHVLSASFDGTVHLWNLAQHTTRTVQADGEVRWVAPGRGEDWAAGTAMGTMYLGSGAKQPQVFRAHDGPVVTGVYSPDRMTLATAGADGLIRLWPAGRSLTGHEGSVTDLAWSQNGARLASGGADGTVRIWDVASGEATLLGRHQGEVPSVAWSPDGAALISVGRDGQAILWENGRGRVLEEHGDELKSVAFGAPGVAAWGGRDGRVRLWIDGAVRVVGTHQGVVRVVAFAPDGKSFASGGDDRAIRVFWVATGATAALLGHEAWIRDLHFAPDGAHLLSASDDGTARLWPLPTPAEPGARRVAFGPAGALLAVADVDRSVRVGAVGPLGWNGEPRVFTGHSDEVYRVAFSPDGALLVSAGRDRSVRVWDLASGSNVTLPTGLRATRLAVGPGRRIAVATPLSMVSSWSLETGEQFILLGHEGRVRDLAFLPDGRLATASEDRTVRVWERDGAKSRVFSGAAAGLFLVAVASDGKHVAAGGDDGVVHVWEVDGDSHASYPSHEGVVTALAFGREPATFASGGSDRTILLHQGEVTRRLGPVGGAVTALVFTDDELIAASNDGAVHTWKLADARGRVLLLGHGPILGLAVSPERALVAAASDAEGLRVIPLAPLPGGAASVHELLDRATGATTAADGVLDGGFVLSAPGK